jgi:two-component system alkaline phosphatase synthesis response regulator PhoP
MKAKILLADDEKDIIEFLKYNLEIEGFEVITAYDGEEALSKISQKPDLILLDIMMPKVDGFEVCNRIRQIPGFEKTPVIFLTAKSGELDEIHGLELGANDYIKKPISPKKLIAPLVINKDYYTVFIEKEEKIFPRKEFELLYYLANHPGKVFSRDALLKDIWGTGVYVVDRTIDVHIRKIREKLDDHADLIETIKGVGYRFKRGE